jgi:hypothetical protein
MKPLRAHLNVAEGSAARRFRRNFEGLGPDDRAGDAIFAVARQMRHSSKVNREWTKAEQLAPAASVSNLMH